MFKILKLIHFQGPSEAERKLDELTRQIEEEFALQESSGAYLGICGLCGVASKIIFVLKLTRYYGNDLTRLIIFYSLFCRNG